MAAAPAVIEAELAAFRGGWLEQQPVRSVTAVGFQTFVLLMWGFWRAGGLMLVGMALFKGGVFSAGRSPRFYAGLVAAAVAIGLPLQAYGLSLDFAAGGRSRRSSSACSSTIGRASRSASAGSGS